MNDALAGVGERMDRMYRLQRHIYDLTRKYYLLGRDQLIDEVAVRAKGAVLEIGCGTGRNLIRLARRRGGLPLYGIDASSIMLATAETAIGRAGLADRVRLAQALGESFDPHASFGLDRPFNAIMISYALSMIPPWIATLERAITCLEPGGTLHVVDFGDQSRMPKALSRALESWLGLFGVEPRRELSVELGRLAKQTGRRLQRAPILGGYAERLTLLP